VAEDVYNGRASARARKVPADVKTRLLDRLTALNAAVKLDDLKVPASNKLEALKGDLAGYHSIRVNDQWRLVFQWTLAGPAEVRFTDYH
jgi:proteic killer suppression protein